MSKVVYKDKRTPVTIICPIHGEIEMCPDSLLKGCQCRYCAKHHYTTDEVKELIMHKYQNNELDLTKLIFQGFRKKVKVKCNNCGKVHDVRVEPLIKGSFQCDCSRYKPKLEVEIERMLTNEHVAYTEYKTFDWLGLQSLDFFIPSKNIAIECQGKQHFGEGGWTKNFDFETQFERDIRKFRLCQEHGITILYFSDSLPKFKYFSEVYTDINKIIELIK